MSKQSKNILVKILSIYWIDMKSTVSLTLFKRKIFKTDTFQVNDISQLLQYLLTTISQIYHTDIFTNIIDLERDVCPYFLKEKVEFEPYTSNK
jgi:hypothetical protein